LQNRLFGSILHCNGITAGTVLSLAAPGCSLQAAERRFFISPFLKSKSKGQ